MDVSPQYGRWLWVLSDGPRRGRCVWQDPEGRSERLMSKKVCLARGASEREGYSRATKIFDGCKDFLLDGPQRGKSNRDVQKRRGPRDEQ
jgi:hypothetical protein